MYHYKQLTTSVNALTLEDDAYPVWKIYALGYGTHKIRMFVVLGDTREKAKSEFGRLHPDCPIIIAMGRRCRFTPFKKPGRPHRIYDA